MSGLFSLCICYKKKINKHISEITDEDTMMIIERTIREITLSKKPKDKLMELKKHFITTDEFNSLFTA